MSPMKVAFGEGGWIASVVVVVVVEDSLRLRAFGWGRDLVGG